MHIFNIIVIASLLILGTGFSGVVQAQSLWVDNSTTGAMFSDRKAHSVGDIVTIVISESSSASRSGQADNSKSTDVKMNAGTGSLLRWITENTAGSSDKFSAKGSLSNSNRVTGKVTATITEIKPNGNFVISGTQRIKQNADEQIITLTGMVRPDDIAADNTVQSSYIADAQIKIDGKGPISSKQRQGILSQIWNFLF